MMKNELEERVGPVEDWQWEVAHHVYQNHASIKDVGGKDQIAALVKQGFGPSDLIMAMYKEIAGPPVVKYQQEDIYSKWDVTHEGFCVNTRQKTRREVYQVVCDSLKTQHPDLWGAMDYFSLEKYGTCGRLAEDAEWPTLKWLAIFYVTGGSEGHYIHVESRKDGKAEILMLGKVFGGRDSAEVIVNALSRIMEV